MAFVPTLTIDSTAGDAEYILDEVTFCPFILSPAEVYVWLELVVRRAAGCGDAEVETIPTIRLDFDRAVSLRADSGIGFESAAERERYLFKRHYMAIGQMNAAMYSELWYEFLDDHERVDLFSRVYGKPIRVVPDAYEFEAELNSFFGKDQAGYRRPRSSMAVVSGTPPNIYEVRDLDGVTLFEVEQNSRAEGPCVMRRVPWAYRNDRTVPADCHSLSFVGHPKLRALSDSKWDMQILREGVAPTRGLLPGENVRCWIHWAHPSPLAEGVLTSPSISSSSITLTYELRVAPETTCLTSNSFIRIAPEYEYVNDSSSNEFESIPHAAVIFSEWRPYEHRYRSPLRHFSRAGARQFHISKKIKAGHQQLLCLQESFADGWDAAHRLTLSFSITVAVGYLTNIVVNWSDHPERRSASLTAMTIVVILGLAAWAALVSLNVTKNPTLAAVVAMHTRRLGRPWKHIHAMLFDDTPLCAARRARLHSMLVAIANVVFIAWLMLFTESFSTGLMVYLAILAVTARPPIEMLVYLTSLMNLKRKNQ